MVLSRLRKVARELVTTPRATSRPTSSPVTPAVPTAVEGDFDASCPSGPILRLDRCPVCGNADSTPRVCRYNKFVTYPRVPDAASMVYDYALCHACGVVYATL